MEVRKYYQRKDKIPYTKTSVLRLTESAKLRKEGLILDIGCNGGHLRTHLKDHETYIGLDIASKWYNKDFNFCLATATHLPFKDKSFDTVFALEVIEHLFNYNVFLRDVRRVLKDNGVFVLSTPNIVCLVNRMKILFGLPPSYFGKGSGHVQCFTFKTLKETLSEDGFEIVKGQPLFISVPPRRITLKLGMKYNRKIAKIFPTLNDIILVKAQKRQK